MATVICIEEERRNKNRRRVTFDDGSVLSLPLIVLMGERIKEGSVVDGERLAEIVDKADFELCKEKAFSCVARRRLTEFELTRKLRESGFCDGVVTRAIAVMKEYRYVDDRSYAEAYVSLYGGSRGAMRLKYELLAKGVDAEVVADALDGAETDASAAARALAEKFTRSHGRTKEDRIKLIRYVMVRGFAYSDAKEAADAVFDGDGDDFTDGEL